MVISGRERGRPRKRGRALGLTNVETLVVMDAKNLAVKDSFFDAVVAQYVITAVPDPERTLDDFIRVLKPGGVIGVKEFDHGGDLLYPSDPALEKYGELYLRLRRQNGHDPETGRKLGALLLAAGLSDLACAPASEPFAAPDAAGGSAFVAAGLCAACWGLSVCWSRVSPCS